VRVAAKIGGTEVGIYTSRAACEDAAEDAARHHPQRRKKYTLPPYDGESYDRPFLTAGICDIALWWMRHGEEDYGDGEFPEGALDNIFEFGYSVEVFVKYLDRAECQRDYSHVVAAMKRGVSKEELRKELFR
jgi:hypothetical protein